jgi:DNA-binding MurR/RpiR family transcriptional regulator
MTDDTADAIPKAVLSRIRASFEVLTTSERKVSLYVSEHASTIIYMSLNELAEAIGVSEATVIRFTRAIGFGGFNEMKMALVADTVNPVQRTVEGIVKNDDIQTITQKVFESNIQLLQDFQQVLDLRAIEKAVHLLNAANRIAIFGVGTSGAMVHRFGERLLRLGFSAHPVIDAYMHYIYSATFSAKDIVVAISRSGTPPTLIDAVREARRNRIKVIALTSDGRSPLAKQANVVLISATRQINPQVVPSPIVMYTLVDVLYTALAMQDFDRTTRFEGRIQATWERWQSWERDGAVET